MAYTIAKRHCQSWGKPLIDAKRLTIAKLAQQQGYQTACIGKWHLGMDWQIPEDQKEHFTGFGGKAGGGGESLQAAPTEANRDAWKSLFSKKIEDGPTEKGFHTYFGTEFPIGPLLLHSKRSDRGNPF